MLTNIIFASLAGAAIVRASPTREKRCTGQISSIADVTNAKTCTTIVINSMTVPAQTTLDLTGLLSGTTVTVKGDVKWTGKAVSGWVGPMFSIDGEDITFDGGNHVFDGQGQAYWDGKGSNGGVDKPKFLRVTSSGTFSNLNVLNSPRQVFSIGNKQTLVINNVKIDNTAGDALGSDGNKLGHNTDCFDVSASSTTIQNSSCKNQDDCLAINSGSGINFLNNVCSGGHGISIGSIASGKTVSNVLIKGNTVINSDNGLRIKTISKATDASVSNITYDGNQITNASQYGLVIEQDYLNGGPTGTPTNGVTIKGVKFSGAKTSISVTSKATPVYILCGSACSGFDFTQLSATGGVKKKVVPTSLTITGYTA